jgi:hypothetical protein
MVFADSVSVARRLSLKNEHDLVQEDMIGTSHIFGDVKKEPHFLFIGMEWDSQHWLTTIFIW